VSEFIVLGDDERGEPCLFVYLRSMAAKKLSHAPSAWQGLPIHYLIFGKASVQEVFPTRAR
jgi:hypothetical protein